MIYARRAEASVTVCLMHRSSPEPSPPRFSDRRDRVSFSCVGSNYHRGIEEIVFALFLPTFFSSSHLSTLLSLLGRDRLGSALRPFRRKGKKTREGEGGRKI